MKILYLTFYFKPDLCAGSFRNTPLVEALKNKISSNDEIDVITTMPNRYITFKAETKEHEKWDNISITRIHLSKHKSGFTDQILSFKDYFFKTLKLTKNKNYDIVFASSSRLFTAFLGAVISKRKNIPLYLDIRDIFTDTMSEIIQSRLFRISVFPLLKKIEKYTFSQAKHINLISKGFEQYFKKSNYKAHLTFFTNGIDDEFIEPLYNNGNGKDTKYKIITYAGNIGEGQGLHKIIPEVAVKLNEYKFKIIGDGGAKKKLLKRMEELNVNNVEIIPPVNRKQLLEYYAESDYLFLHLNSYRAFEKVLPSKIFEYGATNKKIIAGISGYALEFVKENLPDTLVFEPGNSSHLINQLKNLNGKITSRDEFIRKFRRSVIMDQMAESILNLCKEKKCTEYL